MVSVLDMVGQFGKRQPSGVDIPFATELGGGLLEPSRELHRVDPFQAAGFGQRLLATAAVVDPHLLEHARQCWLPSHQFPDGGGQIDHGTHVSSCFCWVLPVFWSVCPAPVMW